MCERFLKSCCWCCWWCCTCCRINHALSCRWSLATSSYKGLHFVTPIGLACLYSRVRIGIGIRAGIRFRFGFDSIWLDWHRLDSTRFDMLRFEIDSVCFESIRIGSIWFESVRKMLRFAYIRWGSIRSVSNRFDSSRFNIVRRESRIDVISFTLIRFDSVWIESMFDSNRIVFQTKSSKHWDYCFSAVLSLRQV